MNHDTKKSDADTVAWRDVVREKYAKAIVGPHRVCCGDSKNTITSGLYSAQEIQGLPQDMITASLVAIEAGKRNISAEELDLFSKLYGVGVDELLHGNVSHQGRVAMFARSFSALSDIDQQEIII
ncbi:hypothetical protein NXG27_06115 [Megasphaera paucivorans]|uniref:HTH cro/C1-type domain-containing protein n=1 Tax=Megasphaera paucivorans TaxID=349095 RepID=A0A1H0ADL8_9FIRM|nr:helix-turn-helix transcriptional regulator [Megasphaera paucivorans]SDN31414.1 hypothetical protein SAMN05660299_02505 [Megasphaera paucivorans]